MGYRVGSMCFQTEAEAADYKMSLVVPTVAADGSLKLPVRKADGWYYGGTTVTKPRPYPYPGNQTVTVQNKVILSHPQCDPYGAFKDGLLVAAEISVLFVIAFAFKTAVYLFKSQQKTTKE